MRIAGRSSRRTAALTVVVLLLAASMVGDGSASPVGEVRPVTAAPGIPPIPFFGDNGAHVERTVAEVVKAKQQVTMPASYLRSNITLCFPFDPAYGVPVTEQCPDLPAAQPLLKTLPLDRPGVNWSVVYDAPNWVVSTPAPNLTYGVFPAVRTRTLAFGSIPVEATVHVSQTQHGGFYDPLKLTYVNTMNIWSPGLLVYPGWPPSPPIEFSGLPYTVQFQLPITLVGTVDVRISDVTVDGQPLPVGDNCHTAGPAGLRFTAPGGYYDSHEASDPRGEIDPLKYRGTPAGFKPLRNGVAGYLDGALDLPGFTNCRGAGEDVSRLVTAMVSGSTYPISSLVDAGMMIWCAIPVSGLDCSKPATVMKSAQELQRRISQATSPSQARQAIQELRRLTAAMNAGSEAKPSFARVPPALRTGS